MNSKFFVAIIAFALSSSALFAESLPLQSVNKAGEVIDAAIEAHGGEENISNLKTLARKSEFTNIATGQSRKPGPPYDKNQTRSFSAIDLENQRFITKNKGEGGGFVFNNGTIINGEESWQLNFRAGTASPIAEPDYNTQSGPFTRVTPVLLIRQLQARRNTSHWLGEVDVDGRKHDVITLVMEVGPGLALYFDQETHMLTRMERVLPPFGQVEYRFLDYTMVDGIAFNQEFRLYLNGEDNLVIDIKETRVNESLDQYVQVPADLRQIAAAVPDPVSTQEIAEGVFLIGGNRTYSMFVEMEDHVVAIGGTQIAATSIKEMRKEIEDKPIRYGVLTHHHNDHVPGAAAYAAEGATIITFEENRQVVLNAAGDEKAKLEFVEDRMTLTDGERTIELYNVGPNPHAENILIVHLPDEGIVFQADLFPVPANGVIPPAVPATVSFAARLDELNLEYSKLVGAHSPEISTPADMSAALGHASASVSAGQ